MSADVMLSQWERLSSEEAAARLALLISSPSIPQEVNRSFGPSAVFTTGVDELDKLLPDGGLTCGVVLEIFGPAGSGKSYIVKQMLTAFAVRGAVEWCSEETADKPPQAIADTETSGLQSRREQVEQDGDYMPHDWRIFLVVSDPMTVDLRSLRQLLREKLCSELSRAAHCKDDVEALLSRILEKVDLVTFHSPNDLLVFFRYLRTVEYRRSMHHEKCRRVLLVVDSITRLWLDPAIGGTGHSRHWFAAELAREVRNALTVGNGWRDCDRGGGGIAVVIVNGCSTTNAHRVVPSPVGAPVWLAAGADIRLLVEQFFAAETPLTGIEETADETGTIVEDEKCTKPKIKMRLVKGACIPAA
ncbi:putative Rad51 [Trypanosoma vivax]|nr:putative DNA repair protein [Trypanosoma vivax]KAH8607088.1 putative Rad51 [Trypanosoma vivax]